jgi:type IV secretion system protein VirB11
MIDAVYRHYLDPLTKYFQKDIKEFVMNSPSEILLETTKGQWLKKHDKELNKKWAKEFSNAMAAWTGQKVGDNHPTISFKIPQTGNKYHERGGHRVQIFYGETCKSGFAMVVRLNVGMSFTFKDFGLTDNNSTAINKLVKDKRTLLISGGTGTGKTSFLNSLLHQIPMSERIITIEGVSELRVPHTNCLNLFYSENGTLAGNRGVAELLNETLRARPDRIILGELRKENSFAFLRAINTGHGGSYATIHANSPQEAITALIDNMVMNGDVAEGAIATCRSRLLDNIDGIVQLERKAHGIMSARLEIIKSNSKLQEAA